MTSRQRWRSVAATGIGLIVLGCGAQSSDVNGSQVGPSPVVLKDTSAGQLAVVVALNLGGYDGSTRDRAMIDVMIQHDGHPVMFIAGEHITCGGVALKRFTGAFEGIVPTASIAGNPMTCVYTSGQQSAALIFRVPKQLVIISPREHEQIPHGPHTTITFQAELDTTLWLVALGAQAKASVQVDAVTTTSASLNTSAISAGEGSIALTQPTLPLKEMQGLQFQSVSGGANAMTMVSVMWV